MRTIASRVFALQSSMTSIVVFALLYNWISDRYMIGYSVASSIVVGIVVGLLIGVTIVACEFCTLGKASGTRSYLSLGSLSGFLLYAINCQFYLNAGWTWHGAIMSCVLGLVCGSAYAASVWMSTAPQGADMRFSERRAPPAPSDNSASCLLRA